MFLNAAPEGRNPPTPKWLWRASQSKRWRNHGLPGLRQPSSRRSGALPSREAWWRIAPSGSCRTAGSFIPIARKNLNHNLLTTSRYMVDLSCKQKKTIEPQLVDDFNFAKAVEL